MYQARQQPADGPPAGNALAGLPAVAKRQDKSGVPLPAEKVISTILNQFHAVNEPGRSVVQQVIARQAECVESVPDFPQARIDALAENAVDLLCMAKRWRKSNKNGWTIGSSTLVKSGHRERRSKPHSRWSIPHSSSAKVMNEIVQTRPIR